MADIIAPKGRVSFLQKPAERTSMLEALQDWRQVALTCQPALNADYVRTVSEEIVRRAEVLASTNRLEFAAVAGFLLERSRAWVMGGLPVGQIGQKLPKTLGDLGMMKIAEGGRHGEPLAIDDLKSALSRTTPRTIQ